MFGKFYEILGLKKGASKEDIKNAYRLLAKKYHPDVSDEPDASNRFIEITEAYEILMNRKIIDDLRATSTDSKEQQYTYEYFTRQAKEKAKQAAEMRYEKLREEHEAFQKSGLYDIILLLNYALNIFLVLLALFLLAFPVYIAVKLHFYGLVFLWIPGVFLVLYIKAKGREFFRLGSFFYNVNEIRQVIKEDSGTGVAACAYSKNSPADSFPYKISLLKVHGIDLHFTGVLQHRATYRRIYKKLQIPRSKKAYRMHTSASIIKSLVLLAALFLVPFDSILWRFIVGVAMGGVLAGLVLSISGIRSKISYLLNISLLAKILAWLALITAFSDFSNFPNIMTHDYIVVGILLMLFFQDMLVDPLVRLFTRKGKSGMPLIHQPESMQQLYLKGYQPYLEIPVWSTVFPLVKWLF